MWIELPDDIEEYLIAINDTMNKEALALNALFDAMLKGKHIVFASRKLLNRIQKLEYLNESNRDFISWIKQKYIYLYECRDIIEYKVIITGQKDVFMLTDKIYKISLEYFFDIRESKLLTENESDGEFFKDIFQYIKRKNNMSCHFDIKFENDSFHGGNASAKVLQIAKEERISLCIIDSDKEMEGDKRGDTYRGANNAYKKVKNKHIILLKELGVREKENLLPPKAYMTICDKNQTLLQTLDCFVDDEKIIKYFDIKDGVKFKRYQQENWKKYYDRVISKLIERDAFTFPPNGENVNDFKCVEGIGEKACNTMSRLLLKDEMTCVETLKNTNVNDKNKKIILEMRDDIENILPEYIMFEWLRLHKLLFDWGCCVSRNSLPMYKM